jgi:predicted phage gp36 major capsid-like protein
LVSLLESDEHRVLSKASSAAGGYLVPTSFDEQITAARRARAVIGAISRELVTGDGSQLLIHSTTTHGVATWTGENVAYTTSDETFGQVTVGAFKGATQVVVSEELARRCCRLRGLPCRRARPVDRDARGAFRSLAVLVDTAGGLVLPTLHAAEPTLFSRPVYQSADLAAAAANARSVVVGDFSLGYLVRRVRGVAVQRQDEILSNNGQLGFRASERVDGPIIVADALRILVNSAT